MPDSCRDLYAERLASYEFPVNKYNKSCTGTGNVNKKIEVDDTTRSESIERNTRENLSVPRTLISVCVKIPVL